MRAIIIDDEKAAIYVLSSMLSQYKTIEIVGSYTDVQDALADCKRLQPNVIFLDIEMGPKNGLEFISDFADRTQADIVFVTAYSQYAVEAFEVNALDYLLKPVQPARLDKTIQKLAAKYKQNEYKTADHASPVNGKVKLFALTKANVHDCAGEPVNWRTKKAKELFFYLWVNEKRQLNKSVIIETIFPDKDYSNALPLLHTTVYQLRQKLTELGYPKGIVYANESYRLDIEVDSDAEQLYMLLQRKSFNEQQLANVIRIYGEGLLAEEDYHWAEDPRHRLAQKVSDALLSSVDEQAHFYGEQKTMEKLIAFVNKITPFDDHIIKATLNFLGKRKKYQELASYYFNYKKMLWQELKSKPEQEIEKLYKFYLNQE